MTDIWTRSQSEQVDHLSITTFGIPARNLMEAAGAGVSASVLRHFSLNRPILVLCGHGNNGGDGYVAARLLNGLGANVTVISPDHDPRKMTPATREQWQAFEADGAQLRSYTPDGLADWAKSQPVIIDALFGLGLRGQLKDGPAKALLKEAARIPLKSVVAVDLPSGLLADDFTQSETVLRADLTVTFGAAKPVHVLSPARDLCGEVEVVDIGFAPEAVATAWRDAPLRWHVETSAKRFKKTQLGLEAHKYTRGHVLIVGGSHGKSGAPQLAAHAALRTGAGWVTLALPEKTTLSPEFTQEDFFAGGVLDIERLGVFVVERHVKAVVLGPGTMGNPLTSAALTLLRDAMVQHGLFVVLDAGALHQLGPLLEKTPLVAEKVVLTPHPGEWKKLCAPKDLSLAGAEDVTKVLAMLARWGVTALYKSATPIVFNPLAPRDVMALTTRTNALGKAGSGDILTGVVAALGARGMKADLAALTGQALLQRNSERFASTHGADALTPMDLIALLGD